MKFETKFEIVFYIIVLISIILASSLTLSGCVTVEHRTIVNVHNQGGVISTNNYSLPTPPHHEPDYHSDMDAGIYRGDELAF